MNIYKKVCGKISDHRKYEDSPFDELDGSEKKVVVHPKFFAIMVKLPTASRVLLNYIVSNARNGKIELDYSELISPDAAVQSKSLFRLGIIELLNWKVLARGEKKGVYWVNQELVLLPSTNQTEIIFEKQAISN